MMNLKEAGKNAVKELLGAKSDYEKIMEDPNYKMMARNLAFSFIDVMGDGWFTENDVKRQIGLTPQDWQSQMTLMGEFGYMLAKIRKNSKIQEYRVALDYKVRIEAVDEEISVYEEAIQKAELKRKILVKKQEKMNKEQKAVDEIVEDLKLVKDERSETEEDSLGGEIR